SGFRGSMRSPPQKPSASPGDPARTPPLAPVLQLLRNQLQEKDALIRHLENDWERSRAQREREERLLVTAWYNMVSEGPRGRRPPGRPRDPHEPLVSPQGLALQQQEGGTAARSGPGGAQSFLAQQRLATVARRARTPHGRAPSS
ncbi:HOOK2 protein, partial [Irena cyanogastra]|nr:HOOK2 protein [Irena cyanogastra]